MKPITKPTIQTAAALIMLHRKDKKPTKYIRKVKRKRVFHSMFARQGNLPGFVSTMPG